MVRMYREGLTAQEIADRVGLSKSTVLNDLALGGVTFRTGWSRKTPRDTAPASLTDEQLATARETRQAIGLRLREERIGRQWEQTEVAAKLEVAASVLSRLEFGHPAGQPLSRYLKLAAILGVRLSDIVRDAEERVLSTGDSNLKEHHGH